MNSVEDERIELLERVLELIIKDVSTSSTTRKVASEALCRSREMVDEAKTTPHAPSEEGFDEKHLRSDFYRWLIGGLGWSPATPSISRRVDEMVEIFFRNHPTIESALKESKTRTELLESLLAQRTEEARVDGLEVSSLRLDTAALRRQLAVSEGRVMELEKALREVGREAEVAAGSWK